VAAPNGYKSWHLLSNIIYIVTAVNWVQRHYDTLLTESLNVTSLLK
jgi:hypothetical protein